MQGLKTTGFKEETNVSSSRFTDFCQNSDCETAYGTTFQRKSDGLYYHVSQGTKNFEEAVSHCDSLGARLPHAGSQSQFELVRDMAKDMDSKSWMGLKVVEGTDHVCTGTIQEQHR